MASGKPNLVVAESPNSSASEAYRFLRLAVQVAESDRQLRTLLVASADGGGQTAKAEVVANLAGAFALDGREVILVDADLRRPSLHDLLGLDNDGGLTSWLQDAEGAPPPIQASNLERLRVITAGPGTPRPAEVLGSPGMAAALTRLKQQADLVVLDTAPVLAAADAAVLARQVDGCLLVVWRGKTRREDGVRAKEALERAGASVLGVVLGVDR